MGRSRERRRKRHGVAMDDVCGEGNVKKCAGG
jgi:hypothetical protein